MSNINLTAPYHDYNLTAPARKVGVSQSVFTGTNIRIDVSSNTRVTPEGDTRVVNADTVASPYFLTARPRSYNLTAPQRK